MGLTSVSFTPLRHKPKQCPQSSVFKQCMKGFAGAQLKLAQYCFHTRTLSPLLVFSDSFTVKKNRTNDFAFKLNFVLPNWRAFIK